MYADPFVESAPPPSFVLSRLAGAPILGYVRNFAGRDGVSMHVGMRGFDGGIVPSSRFVFVGWDGVRALAAELLRLVGAHEGGRDGLE